MKTMSNDTPPPLPPTPQKSKKNGCLIACAIVVIFGILFILLMVPVITNAIHVNKATSLKQKSRGIWVAIVTANSDRELTDLPPFWPGDLAKHGITFTNAEEYFTYLMSDGINTTVIAPNSEQRLVPDLKPESLTAPGLTAAKPGGPVLPENNAWHVVMINDESPPEMPFLVSRNAKASVFSYSKIAEFQTREAVESTALIPLNKSVKPYGDKLLAWISKGGATLDAKKNYLNRARLFYIEQPEGEPPLTVLPAQGGFR